MNKFISLLLISLLSFTIHICMRACIHTYIREQIFIELFICLVSQHYFHPLFLKHIIITLVSIHVLSLIFLNLSSCSSSKIAFLLFSMLFVYYPHNCSSLSSPIKCWSLCELILFGFLPSVSSVFLLLLVSYCWNGLLIT